jgi:hypothetical protein
MEVEFRNICLLDHQARYSTVSKAFEFCFGDSARNNRRPMCAMGQENNSSSFNKDALEQMRNALRRPFKTSGNASDHVLTMQRGRGTRRKKGEPAA